jgi:hypothetical protein
VIGLVHPTSSRHGSGPSAHIPQASRPSDEWNDDDYDVLADGAVVGRIFKANASPVEASLMWTLTFGHHEDRALAYGYAETPRGRNNSIRQEVAAGVRVPQFEFSARSRMVSDPLQHRVSHRLQTQKHEASSSNLAI